MADIKIPESIPCNFDTGWGTCGKPSDNGLCSIHEHLTCVSCGKKAVKNCSSTMGSLCCGANLCETCEHDENDNHVTKEIAEQQRQTAEKELQIKIASRTSNIQRMNEQLGVPCNLFELLKGDWKKNGYEIEKLYALSISVSVYGYPAIFSNDKKRVAFTSDLNLLERLWQTLTPKKCEIYMSHAYVNTKLGIAYLEPSKYSTNENEEPFKLLTSEEFDSLIKNFEKPFRWAPGFISPNIEKEGYLESLLKQAKALDPSFKSAMQRA